MEKYAIVTGGAKRVGKIISLSLAKAGYNIILMYNSSEKEALDTQKKIIKLNKKCHLIQCDISKTKSIRLGLDRALNTKNITLLVNNASIFERSDFLGTDEDIFDRHFNINFKAPFFITRDYIKYCNKYKILGHIINVLDSNINTNNGAYFSYLLTKKALFEFTRMVAANYGNAVRANSISIGQLLPSKDWDEKKIVKGAKKLPLNSRIKEDDLVKGLLYLDDAKNVTGENLFIDSGGHL